MLKYVFFAALVGCARAEPIATQDQLYIVAGILGGVCLLLTIAAIFTSVSVINLQTEVKLLKASGRAAVHAVADELSTQQPRREPPYSAYGGRQEDNYRSPPPKDSYRMDRLGNVGNVTYASDPYYDNHYDNHYRVPRPAPPARPVRRDNYY